MFSINARLKIDSISTGYHIKLWIALTFGLIAAGILGFFIPPSITSGRSIQDRNPCPFRLKKVFNQIGYPCHKYDIDLNPIAVIFVEKRQLEEQFIALSGLPKMSQGVFEDLEPRVKLEVSVYGADHMNNPVSQVILKQQMELIHNCKSSYDEYCDPVPII